MTEEAELTHLAEFLHCDFLHVDAPDESFDAVYDIEATCHASDKPSVYGEVFRLLKPGGRFGAYEYCLTDRFDLQDPRHLKIKADIERGGALFDIDDQQTVDNALRSVDLRCWKHGTFQCKPVRQFPGTSLWLVQVFPLLPFAVQESDAGPPTIR